MNTDIVELSAVPHLHHLVFLFLILASMSVPGQSKPRNAAQYARELMDVGAIASSQKVATMVCFSDDESATSFFTLNPSYESTFYAGGNSTKPSFGDESSQQVVAITFYEKGIPNIYDLLGERTKDIRKGVAAFFVSGTKEHASLLLMEIVTSTWNFRISGGVSDAAASDWHGFLGQLHPDPSGLSNPGVTVSGHCELAPMCKNQKDGYCTK